MRKFLLLLLIAYCSSCIKFAHAQNFPTTGRGSSKSAGSRPTHIGGWYWQKGRVSDTPSKGQLAKCRNSPEGSKHELKSLKIVLYITQSLDVERYFHCQETEKIHRRVK